MAKNSSMLSIVLLLGLLMATPHTSDAQTGVCYGTQGDNLPSPKEVVDLYIQKNIRRMRIYSPNIDTLQALGDSNIELMLGIPNSDIQNLASNQANADSWVRDYMIPYNNVKFRYIAVGNEVKSSDSAGQFLVSAMENILNAINKAGLGNQIKVTTAMSPSTLQSRTSSAPSKSSFRPEGMPLLVQVVLFLRDNKSPFLLNVHPWSDYKFNSHNISLEYALFTASSVMVQDGGHEYMNMFDRIVDSFYNALENVGGETLEIVVSETGWPTAGDASASVETARVYNTNLIEHVKLGTPKRPKKPIETYIFSTFDEDQREPEYDKHWGLYYPDKQPKYPIDF